MNDELTSKHLLPVFILLALATLAAWREPLGVYQVYPPTPEPLCDCSADLYNCSDLSTQFEAQQCFDSCWVVRGFDVHRLDADGDAVACEALP